MELMMERDSTDKRIDDLNARVDQRFDAVDHRFDRMEADIRELRGDMKAGFERMDDRFDGLQRLMIQFGGGLLVAAIGLFATQL